MIIHVLDLTVSLIDPRNEVFSDYPFATCHNNNNTDVNVNIDNSNKCMNNSVKECQVQDIENDHNKCAEESMFIIQVLLKEPMVVTLVCGFLIL